MKQVVSCLDHQNGFGYECIDKILPEMMMDQNSKIKWKRGENYEKEY